MRKSQLENVTQLGSWRPSAARRGLQASCAAQAVVTGAIYPTVRSLYASISATWIMSAREESCCSPKKPPIIIFHRRMAPGPKEVVGLKCCTPSLASVPPRHQAPTRVVHDARAASKRPAHINSWYGLITMSALANAMPIGWAWEGSETHGQRILKKKEIYRSTTACTNSGSGPSGSQYGAKLSKLSHDFRSKVVRPKPPNFRNESCESLAWA